MDFLDWIFDLFAPSRAAQPDVPFGRYTDVYRAQQHREIWEKAIELFENGERMEAYRHFLAFLRDEQQGNLVWREEEDGSALHFELQQGSRRVTGTLTAEKVRAQSRIVRVEEMGVGFMRRLLEHNYELKYSRFALSTDHEIAILFDTDAADGSPSKLKDALEELAIRADRQDDLLLDEFKNMLCPVDVLLGGEVPEAEKEAKYAFLQREIRQVFEEFDRAKPDPNLHPSGYAYLLLHLLYKLDYLIRPEGYMMAAIEKARHAYHAASAEEKSPQAKNAALRKELQKLLDRPKEAFFKEIYRTRSTFGIPAPAGHDRLAVLIEEELPQMDWFVSHNHLALAVAIPGYIVGHALFKYALPKPDRDLLHLYFQIMEADFFRELGFQLPFREPSGKVHSRAVQRAIRQIAREHRAEYPRLAPDWSALDFGSPVLFAKTYLEMVRNLDLTESG